MVFVAFQRRMCLKWVTVRVLAMCWKMCSTEKMVIPAISAFSWCCLLFLLIIKAQIPSKICAKQPVFPFDKLFRSYCGRCVRKHSGSWLSNEMKPNRKLNRKRLPQHTLSFIWWGETDAPVCVRARTPRRRCINNHYPKHPSIAANMQN